MLFTVIPALIVDIQGTNECISLTELDVAAA
jgi:hypothetical protein